MVDISNLSSTIVPKSNQLNADQLISGPMTVLITDVTGGSGDDQPIAVHYEGENGRPFLPCKTCRKVLLFAWGVNGHNWVGRSLTLYHDPRVKWAGVEVGGIRISHMSDIEGEIKVSLASTKSQKNMHLIKRLEVDNGPPLDEVLAVIAAATNKAGMDAAKAIAKTLNRPADIEAAQDAFRARVAELKNSAPAA